MSKYAFGLNALALVVALSTGCAAMQAEFANIGAAVDEARSAEGAEVRGSAAQRGLLPGQIVRAAFAAPGETHLYPIELEDGQEVIIYAQNSSERAVRAVVFELLNTTQNATIVGATAYRYTPTLDEKHSKRAMIPETGTFYLRVRMSSATEQNLNSYRAMVRVIDHRPESVPDLIRIGQIVEGESLDYPGDVDRFRFQGRAGQRVHLDFQPLHGPGRQNMSIRLSAPDGTSLTAPVVQRGNHPTLEAGRYGTFRLPADGEYTVHVQGAFEAYLVGPYRFRVTEAN